MDDKMVVILVKKGSLGDASGSENG